MYRAIICAMAVLSSITVLHGGRTDSNGGHYNRSTGEYHYHHGYSAHDHYDMNGDGIIDCPYTFKDNTSESELDDFSKEYYASFEEWSNAKHGISNEQEGESQRKLKQSVYDDMPYLKDITNETNLPDNKQVRSAIFIALVVLVSIVLVIKINKNDKKSKMKVEDTIGTKLLSGANVELSAKVHDECYCNFEETKYIAFSNIINSGLYFPQIVQFIYVITGICKGRTSFKDIFLASLLTGVFYTILWFWTKLYRLIPGINFICCFIGANIFKYLLHFVAIAIVALAVIGNWKIIVYCLISGIITSIIRSFLFAKLSTVKYNDEVAIYVSKFKTNLYD